MRAGYYTILDYRRSSDNNDQYFITCGATYPVGPVEINLSLMDSRLLSPGSLKQTQVACGLNYRIF